MAKLSFFAIFAKLAAFANFYRPPSLLCVFPRWRLWQNFHFRHIYQIRHSRQLLWANFYGPPSLLCVFPRWRLWQNCHFRHICQIRRFRQLLWAPFTALCFSSLAIVAKIIVIFAIFAKFAAFANFYGPPSPLCVFPRWRSWQNCHFRHICQIRLFRQLLWVPFTALCFSSLAIVAKLSFSPYLPNSPLSSTFMGPLNCFVFLLVGDCGKIVIFAIFAKFANIFSFLPFLLLCAFLDISRLIRPNVSICKQLGLSLYC